MGKGRIVIEAGANVWPHEMDTAQALAETGRVVRFVRRSNEKRVSSADVLMDGELWEMKAPTSDKARRVIRTLRDALHQSNNVIFDSRRMKKLSDAQIEHELRKGAAELRSLRRLVFVNRKGKVIDIR